MFVSDIEWVKGMDLNAIFVGVIIREIMSLCIAALSIYLVNTDKFYVIRSPNGVVFSVWVGLCISCAGVSFVLSFVIFFFERRRVA